MNDLEEQIAATKSLLTFLESLRKKSKSETDQNIKYMLKKLVYSSKWPTAINPNLLCSNFDTDKLKRGRGILENVLDYHITRQDSFLDFGCGEGFTVFAATDNEPRLSMGYDIKPQGWCRYPEKENFQLTCNWNEVLEKSPFDVILIYDVLDHFKQPLDILDQIRRVVHAESRIYIRFHPRLSRHGMHGCSSLNRAFCHLFFEEDELRSWGWDGIETNTFTNYRELIEIYKFKIIHEQFHTQEVEKFFTGIPQLATRIAGLEEKMKINFVDYLIKL